MPVDSLTLERFTAFDGPTHFDFCPGINVLIGANSTGKTHVLKALYALIKVCERAHLDTSNGSERVKNMLQDKLSGVFKPHGGYVGRLVRHTRGQSRGQLKLVYEMQELTVNLTTQSSLYVEYTDLPAPHRAVYLPAHEFLSIYEGFIHLYENRETAFDETYKDLAIALDGKPLLGRRQEEIQQLAGPLQKAIEGGRVTQESGRFYVRLPEGKFEAHLVSEGYRKLAGLYYLLINGSLTQTGILFWDEPEANLNPHMITKVVDVLRILAKAGVQIFISTHDYLLSQELSLLAEYLPGDVPMRFFALHRPSRRAGVQVQMGQSLAEIGNNPILDEFAAHYDREADLFSQVEKV